MSAARASPQEPMRIVLISAFFYVAMAAGLVKKGNVAPNSKIEYTAPNVIEALNALIAKGAEATSKDLANAARLHALLHSVFKEEDLPNVSCFFARDWTLEGGTPFRTTWTSGWWLSALVDEYLLETLPERQQERRRSNSPTNF